MVCPPGSRRCVPLRLILAFSSTIGMGSSAYRVLLSARQPQSSDRLNQARIVAIDVEPASSSMGMLGGRVALVTGGSKGLGASTARLFAEAGARVVVTFGNDADAADRLIASLPGTGHRGRHTPAQDTDAFESPAAEIGTTEGRLDILVNNARSTRVIPHADLHALDDAFFDFVLAVNLRGPFATVRACRPLLEASGHGLVVNVGSVAGVRGGGSNIAYAAAKAGLHAMTMSLARALALAQDIELFCRFASGVGPDRRRLGPHPFGNSGRFINRIGQNSAGSRFGAGSQ
jgi:NADP-dependent 3-hydroxy acid dehydrogenase YdfG